LDRNSPRSQSLERGQLFRQILVYAGLCITYFLVYFDRFSGAILASPISIEFEVGRSISWLGAAYFYPYAFMQLPAGILADTKDPKKLIILCQALMSLGYALLFFSLNYTCVVMARFMSGLGSGLFWLSALAVLAESYPDRRYSLLSGLLVVAGNLGGITASAPLAWLVEKYGWRTPLLSLLCLSTVITLMYWMLLKPKNASDLAVTSGRCGGGREIWADIWSQVGRRDVIILSLWNFMVAGTKVNFQSLWGGHYLTTIQRLAPVSAGTVLLFMTLGGMIGSPLSGWLSDVSRSCKTILVAASMGLTMCWLFLSLLPRAISLISNIAIFFAIGMLDGAFIVTYLLLKGRGTAMGIVSSVTFLGCAVLMQLFTVVLNPSGLDVSTAIIGPPQHHAYQMLFFISSICTLLATLSLFFLERKPPALRCTKNE
jgi:MFS family permease